MGLCAEAVGSRVMISSRLKKGAVMDVWVISTIWIGLALVSALISIRVDRTQ
jgi:hypothetical protein